MSFCSLVRYHKTLLLLVNIIQFHLAYIKARFTMLQVWWIAYSPFTVCNSFVPFTSLKSYDLWPIIMWLQCMDIRYLWWFDIPEGPFERRWEVCRDLSLLYRLWLGCHLVRFKYNSQLSDSESENEILFLTLCFHFRGMISFAFLCASLYLGLVILS